MGLAFLYSAVLMAAATALTLVVQRGSSPLARTGFYAAIIVNDAPFLMAGYLAGAAIVAGRTEDLGTPLGWAATGLAALTVAGLAVVLVRGLRARPALARALDAGLGAGWRPALDPGLVGRRRRAPVVRIVLAPFLRYRRGTVTVAGISYGDAGELNQLDVYHDRTRRSGCPTLVYVHGGRFTHGQKEQVPRPLLHRMLSRGWVCVSVNYRLSPDVSFPEHLVDVKKAIAWVREHGHEYGADPETLVVVGGSAGGWLAAMVGLTPDDPTFQPGFEDADTSVDAAVCLYGYYGSLDTDLPIPATPVEYVGPGAPPFLLIHGDADTVVTVDGAREFAAKLRATSDEPVVYAELPGANHAFDLFHSFRSNSVVNAVDSFTIWIRSHPVNR